MSEATETKPKLPDDARLLEVGEIINDGDLHWNATVKHWVAVAPQGEADGRLRFADRGNILIIVTMFQRLHRADAVISLY